MSFILYVISCVTYKGPKGEIVGMFNQQNVILLIL